jgi:hypothetical protein
VAAEKAAADAKVPILHAYSYTPTLTRLLKHASSYCCTHRVDAENMLPICQGEVDVICQLRFQILTINNRLSTINKTKIDKNSVGYDFLNDRLGHLSNRKLKTKNTEDITPELLSQEVVEKRKVGRPKGSKNIIKMNIPQHEIIDSQIISAVQDIIWYKPGMLAIEIVSQLKYDNSIEKLIYAKLHEHANVHWKKYVVKLPKSKSIERYYPIKDRSGYYYNGELLSLGEISKITGKSKQILSYRIKKGMNHIEAINTQIKENMIRKNPGQ